MKNADKFKSVFGLYATEVWAMPEGEFLKWLNSECTETEQGWIPCSERMPKKTGYYICTCHDGTYYRTSVLKWSTGWTLTGARSYWKVIAWMPLPEPYAERRQDALN